MAWFDSYANAPTVITEESVERDRYNMFFIGTTIQQRSFTRLVTTSVTEYRGLTLTAAQTGAGLLADTNKQVRLVRENPAGAYTLQVVEETKGSYVEDT